jgi:hypothetical protein
MGVTSGMNGRDSTTIGKKGSLAQYEKPAIGAIKQ